MPITTITIADINDAIAAIKDTPSEKVEWNDDSASLKQIVSDVRTALLERGIYYASTINEMQLLNNTDTLFVHVNGVGASNGIYSYRSSGGAPNYITSFPSAGGGLWVLNTVNTP